MESLGTGAQRGEGSFYLLKFVSYSQQEGSAILISSHDGLIALLALILQVALVHGLQVSLALGIEQIVCLEEDGDAGLWQ